MLNQSIQSSSIMTHFSVLKDPRKPRNQLYSLCDLISTAILATLCCADDYYSMSLFSAFSSENSLVLGQLKCKNKGHEFETIQRLLEILDIKGATVTSRPCKSSKTLLGCYKKALIY